VKERHRDLPAASLARGTLQTKTLEGCERRVAKRKVATRDPSGDPEEPDLDIIYVFEKNGAPEEIRTPDPQIRSLVLYPAELRVLLPEAVEPLA
jgi:hypothetical protein